MKKRTIITGLICALVLGTCSLPFLPISGPFLNSYENEIRLASYNIDARIILSETANGQMNINAYFSYPAVRMLKDGCFLEVSVNLEGQTSQKYPNHVQNTEYEKNFPKENISSTSINDSTQANFDISNENRRLILSLYDEPLVEQIFTLNLKPLSDQTRNSCHATQEIKHKIRYHRVSMIEIAMGV